MTFKPDIKREVNGEILKTPADIIQFSDGYYETEDEKKIAFIKRHKDFGLVIHIVEEPKKEPKKTEETKQEEDLEIKKARAFQR